MGGETKESENCEKDQCPFKEWGEWSECSVTCGINGTRTRTRECREGIECTDDLGIKTEVGQCSEDDRGLCSWKPWSEWTECSVSCGPGGVRNRTRECQDFCREGEADEQETCNEDVNCPSKLLWLRLIREILKFYS